jgi:hypothetical protein
LQARALQKDVDIAWGRYTKRLDAYDREDREGLPRRKWPESYREKAERESRLPGGRQRVLEEWDRRGPSNIVRTLLLVATLYAFGGIAAAFVAWVT